MPYNSFMKTKKIDKKINIAELIDRVPESVDIMMEYGLGCVGCMASGGESLEEGAKAHGLNNEEIEEMVGEINEKLD